MKLAMTIILAIIIVAAAVFMFMPRQNEKSDYQSNQQTTMGTLEIKSSAFEDGGTIPKKYSCDGQGINPPLEIFGVPAAAKSLALVMHDPDAPITGGFTHWVVWNMATSTQEIAEGTKPDGVPGKNSGGAETFFAPCPHSGTHRYVFSLYALDVVLGIPAGSSKTDLEDAMSGHIISEAQLTGLYARN